MTTPLDINVRERGAEETSRRLRGVSAAVGGVATQARRSFSPLLGMNVITGLLGGSLIGMALAGGSGANAMLRLQSAVADLLDPFVSLLAVAVEWFARLPTWVQYLIALGVVIIALLSPLTSLGRTIGAVAGVNFGRAVLSWLGPLVRVALVLFLVLGLIDELRRIWPQLEQVGLQVNNAITNSIVDLANSVIDLLNLISRAGEALYLLGSNPANVRLAFTRPPVISQIARQPNVRPQQGPLGPSLFDQTFGGLSQAFGLLQQPSPTAPASSSPPVFPQAPTYNNFFGLDANAAQQLVRETVINPADRSRQNGGP